MRRKGLIAVALLIAAVLIGFFAAQYYIWTVTYKATVFTKTLGVTLADAPGSTEGSQTFGSLEVGEDPTITAMTFFEVPTGKTVLSHFLVKAADATPLDDAYYTLTATVEVYTVTLAGGLITDKTLVGSAVLSLVSDGSPIASDLDVALSSSLAAGKYYVIMTVDYWTGAVSAVRSGSFPINVYGVEQ